MLKDKVDHERSHRLFCYDHIHLRTIHLHVFVVHEEIYQYLFARIFGPQCGIFLSMGPLQSNDYRYTSSGKRLK